MTTIAPSAPAIDTLLQHATHGRRRADRAAERDKDSQLLGRLTGLFFLLTYATSIPPVLTLYVPALSDPTFVLGGAPDMGLTWGAILEMFLILFNVASAVAIYPVLKRRFPVLSLAFVGARLTESMFNRHGHCRDPRLGHLAGAGWGRRSGDADRHWAGPCRAA